LAEAAGKAGRGRRRELGRAFTGACLVAGQGEGAGAGDEVEGGGEGRGRREAKTKLKAKVKTKVKTKVKAKLKMEEKTKAKAKARLKAKAKVMAKVKVKMKADAKLKAKLSRWASPRQPALEPHQSKMKADAYLLTEHLILQDLGSASKESLASLLHILAFFSALSVALGGRDRREEQAQNIAFSRSVARISRSMRLRLLLSEPTMQECLVRTRRRFPPHLLLHPAPENPSSFAIQR
jgi:hypothetical protein